MRSLLQLLDLVRVMRSDHFLKELFAAYIIAEGMDFLKVAQGHVVESALRFCAP